GPEARVLTAESEPNDNPIKHEDRSSNPIVTDTKVEASCFAGSCGQSPRNQGRASSYPCIRQIPSPRPHIRKSSEGYGGRSHLEFGSRRLRGLPDGTAAREIRERGSASCWRTVGRDPSKDRRLCAQTGRCPFRIKSKNQRGRDHR